MGGGNIYFIKEKEMRMKISVRGKKNLLTPSYDHAFVINNADDVTQSLSSEQTGIWCFGRNFNDALI